jgi:16S rRNA (guanine966-N2)-methyltransferase
MRISGGTAKGRRTATQRLLAKTSTGERLRPTSAKVREALFNILRTEIEGSIFVDLYAGSGTVGLEALSRGAGKAVFVEPDARRLGTIRRHANEFGFHEKVLVFEGRAEEFLRKMPAGKESFDIFFVDPPYQSEEIQKILPMIEEKDLLRNDGIIIAEHFFKKKLPEAFGKLRVKRSYRYGDTMLTLYKKGDS